MMPRNHLRVLIIAIVKFGSPTYLANIFCAGFFKRRTRRCRTGIFSSVDPQTIQTQPNARARARLPKSRTKISQLLRRIREYKKGQPDATARTGQCNGENKRNGMARGFYIAAKSFAEARGSPKISRNYIYTCASVEP